MRGLNRLLLGLCCAVCISPAVRAELGGLDAMIMPGKVITGHARIEGQCKQCHKPFKKTEQNRLCLDCHDHAAVARDIARRTGYHGRLKTQDCRSCHTEHKGRTADIVKLNAASFNHRLTDFPLGGGHASKKVKCADCHRKGSKHREAPQACYACHRKDDKHKGRLGRECERCHVDRGWKHARFDHSKTSFPLRGKHVSVKCDGCHRNQRFEGTPTDCYSCHRGDDVHKGQEGRRCERCHSERAWTRTVFDHGLTRFPLFGEHRRTACKSCHKAATFKDADTECVACHRRDDKHKRHLGSNCGLCHDAFSWKRWRFDHNRQTDFVLDGGHKGLVCDACHKRPVKGRISLSSSCNSCHQEDDVHEGSFGRFCERCHVTSSFRRIKAGVAAGR